MEAASNRWTIGMGKYRYLLVPCTETGNEIPHLATMPIVAFRSFVCFLTIPYKCKVHMHAKDSPSPLPQTHCMDDYNILTQQ